MPTYDNAYESIRAEVLSRMDVGCEVSDESIRAAIDEAVGEYSRNTYLPLVMRQQIFNEIFYELRQLDIIQELIEDPSITDLNSTNGTSLNGTPLDPNREYPLHEGDEVGLGRAMYIFSMVEC